MGEVVRLTNSSTGGPVFVYVKDGKIIRITPMDFDDEVDAPSWKIEARGKTFAPPRKTTYSVYTAGFKSMIYSDKRVMYPDEARGLRPQRRAQLRRTAASPATSASPGTRPPTSWSSEINRVKREAGPAAILSSPSSHHMWGNVGYRHSTYFRFMNMMGFTYADHNPDSWEGWHWGGMHMWGFSWRLGNPEQYDLLEDALQNAEMIVFWSSDPETNTGIYSAHESTVRRHWLKELGVKMVFIDPFYNHTAGLIGDKWFSPKIGTDHALSFAIAYTWLTEGTYDKEYVATHAHGFDEWADYVLGKTDGVPKTCEWAEEESGVPAREIRALAREWGQEEHIPRRRRPRRLGRRLPRLPRHRVGPRHDRARHHAGHGQAGLQHLVDHAGHARRLRLLLPRLRRGRHLRRLRELGRRLQVRLAHVRRQDHLPVAVEHQHVRRPAHPAPQGARVHHGRQVPVGRQGLLPAATSSTSSTSTSIRRPATRRSRCCGSTAAPGSAP